ncbi:hypothetical protein ACH5RR_010426 [Cinchona calisaya]|uniref:Protein XRI1 n=1 Tax=Cinchona calisaya TaxID=153742 RepID=A0ABD3AIX9_9GENT
MDYADTQNNEMLDWQSTNNCLEGNLDISKCLWSGVNQKEDFSFMLGDEITPVKDCGDLPYYTNNFEEMSKGLEKCEEPSSQVKRRRMLQFNSDGVNAPFCNEDESSTYILSKERENSAKEAAMSQLVPGYADGTSSSCYESLDQSFEGWLASCFTDSDRQITPNDLGSDVQIDIEELFNNQPESVSIIQDSPVQTRRNVFKGRKSYIQTSANSTSSVAYPFAFIKPCGVDGDVTLKDINQRIRTPSSKSKPINDDNPACYPTSAFSGKPVVGSTKIRTEGGQGSITIMRTKG